MKQEESLSDKINDGTYCPDSSMFWLDEDDVKEAVKKIIDRISGNESYARRFIFKRDAIRIINDEMGEKLTK